MLHDILTPFQVLGIDEHGEIYRKAFRRPGAFTWAVLDRLLEEPWIRIEAISGTSAGAMNAAVLADGWSMGGADGARAALDAYWRRVSRAAAFSPLQRTPWNG
jgi:predicted acylesterase/phospholipase RssA